MADAGDLKSPACNGRVGSNPTLANGILIVNGQIGKLYRKVILHFFPIYVIFRESSLT